MYITLPETNMAPENGGFQSPFPEVSISGATLVSGSVYLSSLTFTILRLMFPPPPKKNVKRGILGGQGSSSYSSILFIFHQIFSFQTFHSHFFNKHPMGFLGNHHYYIFITSSIFHQIIISKLFIIIFSNSISLQRFFIIFLLEPPTSNRSGFGDIFSIN